MSHRPAAHALKEWQRITGEPFQPSDLRDLEPTPQQPCDRPCGWCTADRPCDARREGVARAAARREAS